MPDLISILGQRFTQGNIVDKISNVASIPQHLVTSAFGKGTYLQNLQKGIDPSEFLPKETPGILKFGVDVLADPLNLLIGAGAVSKLAKVGKFSKVVEAGVTVEELAKSEAAVTKTLRFVEELGQSSVRKKAGKTFDQFLVDNKDIFSAVRKTGINKEDALRVVDSAGDSLDLIKSADTGFGTGGGLERIWHAKQSINKIRDSLDKGLDSVKALESATESIGQGLAKGAEAGRSLQLGNLYRDVLVPEINSLMAGKSKSEIKAIREMLQSQGLGEVTPKNIDKFVEWATMSKLWGVSTIVRNTIGNVFTSAIVVPEKFATGVIDAVVSGITRKPREVFLREALAETTGMVHGLKSSFKEAWNVLKNEKAFLEEGTKLSELTRGGQGAISGLKGDIIRAPGKVLVAEDVFFRTFLKEGNLGSLAVKEALKADKTLRGSKLAGKVSEILNSTTEDGAKIFKRIDKIADKNAAERIFQKPLIGIEKTIDEFRHKHPFVKLLVPFFRTPVNLFKQSFQRVPVAGFAMPSFWKTIRSTSPVLSGMAKKEFIETMIARQTVGGIFLGGAWMGAVEGKISGLGPKSKSKRNIMRLSGWQPQSIRIGDKWFSYRGFEPISSWMRAGADAMEGHKEGQAAEESIGKGLLSFMKQFSENPFLMGMNDVFKGINDPEHNWSNMFVGLSVGATIPNILQQWNRTMIDPVLREPKTLSEKFFSRVPLLSGAVPPRRDIFGEQIVRDEAWKSLFGFNVSKLETEKVNTELSRLQMGVGKPSKTINGIELSDKEYDRFYVLKGAMLKKSISQMVNYEHYERLEDEQKRKILSSIIRRVNRIAKSETFKKYYSGEKQ